MDFLLNCGDLDISACVENDGEMVQARYNDVADGLLDESMEQVGEVINSHYDTLDIGGGEKKMSRKSSGSRPLPSFLTVVDKFGDLE